MVTVSGERAVPEEHRQVPVIFLRIHVGRPVPDDVTAQHGELQVWKIHPVKEDAAYRLAAKLGTRI